MFNLLRDTHAQKHCKRQCLQFLQSPGSCTWRIRSRNSQIQGLGLVTLRDVADVADIVEAEGAEGAELGTRNTKPGPTLIRLPEPRTKTCRSQEPKTSTVVLAPVTTAPEEE
ncbi:hypothetical protein NDU88_001002 [Pleurodeles waltl]|uniref:Uncharacterized protein n=1 Tax=Pleurodeles waltl TaxID=8319 RepID=A0AAV7S8P4_PLEWA|nr:hypothetical protein NDU88_001002 [Pleurodeles waltl]